MCVRGDIYLVNFGRNKNTYKQNGVRPALVVSNNRANKNSPVVTVVPLTSKVWKKPFLPTHVTIPSGVGLSKPSMALAEQVEAIDKELLVNKMGHVYDDLIMEQVTVALQIQIGAYNEYN